MDKEDVSNDYNVKSLIKSLNILEVLIENGRMSIGELSIAVGMGKSLVHRILGTYKKQGYVNQLSEDGRYYASIKIFELGNIVANHMPIRTAAKPYLEELLKNAMRL